MKMQWILAVVLIAVVVFIATYLKINTGGIGSPPPPPPPESETTLFFPRTTSLDNEKDPTGAEWESGVPGYYDFWFRNPNDEPVTVGLNSVGCVRCTRVEIALESDEWKVWQAKLDLNLMLRTQGRFDLLGDALTGGCEWALPEPKRDWRILALGDSGFAVPAGASGWVRVHWTSKKIGPETLSATLWTHAQDSSAPLMTLTVLVLMVPPVGVEPHTIDVGVISAERPQSAQKWIAIMSPTREVFTVEPAKENDPFIECGQPLKLSEQGCRIATAAQRVRVKSGYRIPITVHERLMDDRQLDLGPFQLKLFLNADVGEKPLEVTIKGVVEGEVSVLSPEGRIQMGEKGYFDAAYGDVKETKLATRNVHLSLELEKVPSFLKVELKELEPTGGIKTWDMRVEVPRRAVAGEFPREDSEYRDCAIYLKIQDPKTPSDKARRIRIPVSGKASTR
jgi:hypothetical protein